MKALELNEMGVQQMTDVEMKKVDGGVFWIIPFVILYGLIYTTIDRMIKGK